MVPKPGAHSFVRSYPAHASFVANARHDLAQFALSRGVPQDAAHDIASAVGEICAIIVEPSPKRTAGFLIEARFTEASIEVEIADDATRFGNRTSIHDVTWESLAPRGFALKIVKRLVDQVTFLEGGSSVRLVKRLPTH